MRSFTNGAEAVFEKRLIEQLLRRIVERELGEVFLALSVSLIAESELGEVFFSFTTYQCFLDI